MGVLRLHRKLFSAWFFVRQHDMPVSPQIDLGLHLHRRDGAADIHDQIADLLVVEGVLPIVHAEVPSPFLDGLLEISVVLQPGQYKWKLAGGTLSEAASGPLPSNATP